MHHILILAAGIPNVGPDYNNPATPFLTKVLQLVLTFLAFGAVVLFFGGIWRAVSSLGSHHSGGATSGIVMAGGSAIFLALLASGTGIANTWSAWFGG